MPTCTHRRFRLGFAAAALVGALCLANPAGAATGSADLLGCDETVHDPDGVLDLDQLRADIEWTAAWLDADLRVRVEPGLDGGLDERIDQLRRQCPGWDSGDGRLADDLVVLMFSPAERENAIFFGDSTGPAPTVRWDEATDVMIPHLRDGDYTGAVKAGLAELRAVAASVSTSSSTDVDDEGSKAGLVLAIIALVAVVGFSAISKLSRNPEGWEDLSAGSDEDPDSSATGWFGGGSSRPRRRSFGFGSASRRSAGSSTRRSNSSRSSRRAGGGSKKW